MKRIFTARHPAEAHIVKGMLESKGIVSEVRGEALFGARGEIPVWEALPEIWVSEDQANAALENIETETDALETPDAEAWTCSNCGESVEQQFVTCWKCNHNRPEASS